MSATNAECGGKFQFSDWCSAYEIAPVSAKVLVDRVAQHRVHEVAATQVDALTKALVLFAEGGTDGSKWTDGLKDGCSLPDLQKHKKDCILKVSSLFPCVRNYYNYRGFRPILWKTARSYSYSPVSCALIECLVPVHPIFGII